MCDSDLRVPLTSVLDMRHSLSHQRNPNAGFWGDLEERHDHSIFTDCPRSTNKSGLFYVKSLDTQLLKCGPMAS